MGSWVPSRERRARARMFPATPTIATTPLTPRGIRQILTHLGLPTEIPAPRPPPAPTADLCSDMPARHRRGGTQRPATLGRMGCRIHAAGAAIPREIPAPHRQPRHPSSSFRLTAPSSAPYRRPIRLCMIRLSFIRPLRGPRRRTGRDVWPVE